MKPDRLARLALSMVLLMVVLIAADVAAPVRALPDPLRQETRVSTVRLSDHVHAVTVSQTGSLNATFSAGPDGVLVVDTMTEALSASLREQIRAISQGTVRFVVNTHWHGDHVGGNRHFAPATIVAHPQVRARISREQKLPWMPEPIPPEPESAWPAITLDGAASVFFNGEEIRLVPIPGSHTDADVVVIFTRSKVVALGDLIYFAGGRLMPAASTFSGGSLRTLRQNLSGLVPQFAADARVIPGHGPLLTTDDLQAYVRLVDAMLAHVAGQQRDGRAADELKAQGLPASITALTRWPLADDAWIQAAYDALGAK